MKHQTRVQKYLRKSLRAARLPASFSTVCFDFDENLAFLIRTAACYGFSHINVIGSVSDRSKLNSKSGSLYDFVELRQYSNPKSFLDKMREDGVALIAADISPNAESLYSCDFDFSRESSIVLGNEKTGIPVEIVLNSKEVFIPMPGVGVCLNTSQSGTAFATEYSRQYFNQLI